MPGVGTLGGGTSGGGALGGGLPFGPPQLPGGAYLSGASYSPTQAQGAFDLVNPTAQQSITGLQGLAANPLGTPGFGSIVQALLAQMQPEFQQQQNQVTDAFRASGGLRDTSYGSALANLMGQQASSAAGAVASQATPFINAIMQALQAPSNVAQGAARSFPTYQANFARSTPATGGGSSGPSFLDQPFTDLSGVGIPNPYGPGSAATGVNVGQGQPTTPQQNPYDILSQLGLGGGGGGGGIGFDPSSGTFTSMSSAPDAQGLLGYGQGYDAFGAPDTSGGFGSVDTASGGWW